MRINGIVSRWLVAGAIAVGSAATYTVDLGAQPHDLTPAGVLDLFEARTALVGSWIGTSGDGLKLLSTFNADGTMTNSIQTEVSTIPELGVLTPLHGVWQYLGGRQFGVTAIGVLYDINTGAYLGTLKVRIRMTVNKTGDRLSGTDNVEILNPDGTTTDLGSHSTPYTRIKFELFD
ncbi:MAG: hypothetical protein ACRD2I_15160 [Vicinamibacterales bacterium]